MNIRRTITATLAASFAALAIAACGDEEMDSTTQDLPQGGEPVSLDPADFTTEIDNPYWPMAPGSRWVYRETDSEGASQRVEVTVTAEDQEDRQRRRGQGRPRRRHRGRPAGRGHLRLVRPGLGRTTSGTWARTPRSTRTARSPRPQGSWEAGVDGAQPGIVVPADPKSGLAYRQEYYAGEAEDNGEIVSVDEQAEVPSGHYSPRR